MNPKLSASVYVWSNFNYNRIPLVPPEIKVLAHDKLLQWSKQAPNGTIGFVVGSIMEYYRCLEYYFPTTTLQCPVDRITFFPSTIVIPEVGLEDFLC